MFLGIIKPTAGEITLLNFVFYFKHFSFCVCLIRHISTYFSLLFINYHFKEQTFNFECVQNMMVHEDRQAARGSMGVCLQENVIYESLTVEDHLQVVARLRRVPSPQRENEVFLFSTTVHLYRSE